MKKSKRIISALLSVLMLSLMMIIPVNAEINKVKENCVSASLNSKNIFATTKNAVITAIYAILCDLPF